MHEAKSRGSTLRGVVAALAIQTVTGFILSAATAAAAAEAPPLSIDYSIQLVSGNATQQLDGSWLVPVGERIEWEVSWAVTNQSTGVLNSLELEDHYSSEIDVAAGSVNGSTGAVTVAPVGGPNSATAVHWAIGDLTPGATAALVFRVATGLNPQNEQLYGDPGDYCLDSGLRARWYRGSHTLSCVPIHARELAWMRIVLANTVKDWRIRKPGEYASRALAFTIASNSSVSLYFEGFAHLASDSAGAGPLPVSYGAGDSLPEVESVGWWAAPELNDQVVPFMASEALRGGVSWSLWGRLHVSPGQQAAEYEDEGTLIFVLANASELAVVTHATGLAPVRRPG